MTRGLDGTTVVRDVDGIDRLRDSWGTLASSFRGPMQEWGWTRCAAETLPYEPFVVAVDGAIAPLGRPLRSPDTFELLGVDELKEPGDLLWADEGGLLQLAHQLAQFGLPLVLRRVPEGSPSLDALRHAYARVFVRNVFRLPVIELDERWREPEALFSSRWRSDFRRARRRAGEFGAVKFEISSPTPDDFEPLFTEALRVEACSWKGSRGTALLHDPLRLRFFRCYARAAAEAGTLRLCFLRLDGRAAAMQYACQTEDAFWLLKIGYNEQFARASPGQLLMLETIRHAAKCGLRSYEFLGGAEDWTRAWTERERRCVSVYAYPRRSLAAFAMDTARLVRSKLGFRLQSDVG